MKPSITLLGPALTLAVFCSIYSCKSKSILSSKQESSEESSVETRQSELKSIQSIALVGSHRSDSLKEDYAVIIYPVDSFHFSPTDGFSGKALKVKIRGSTQQVSFARDSSVITRRQFTSTQDAVKSEYKHHVQLNTLQKERRTMVYLPIILCILFGLGFGIFVCRIFLKYRGY